MQPAPPRAPSLRRPVLVMLAAAALCSACGPPKQGGGDDAGPGAAERIGPIDWGFPWLQDRYAVMGRWYEYESEGHTIQPRPFVWILADGQGDQARYAAFRIVSYYDSSNAEAGLVTLSLSSWNGAAFDAEQEWVASRNIKAEDAPVCLDVFARAEVDCAGDAWHLMLRMYRDMAPLSAIVIRDPGLFLRSWSGRADLGDVRVARLDDKTDLSGLPDPRTISALQEGPRPDDGTTTDWAFSSFAPNLPENGMAIGTRFVDEGFVGTQDSWVLVNGRFTLGRFQVKPKVDGDVEQGLVFTWSAAPIEREDFSVPVEQDIRTTEVPSPAVGDVVYLSFGSPDLFAAEADVAGASWPFLPPDNNRWDLALERIDDGRLRLLTSPASAVIDVTPHLCDPSSPPPLDEIYPPYLVDEPVDDPCAPAPSEP